MLESIHKTKTRRRQITLLAITTAIFGLYSTIHLSGREAYIAGSPISKSVQNGIETGSGLGMGGDGEGGRCKAIDYVLGKWENVTQLKDEQDLVESYGYSSWRDQDCWPPRFDKQQDKDFSPEDKLHQALKSASPMYIPRNGCHFADLNLEQMIVLMLRMPAGLFMAGDSISGQFQLALNNLLIGPSSPAIFSEPTCQRRTISLDPSHPLTPSLLQSAGVKETRLSYPLMTWYRTVHLVDTEELVLAFNGSSKHVLRPDICVWFDWFDRMSVTIRQALGENKKDMGKEWGSEPTVLVVDTGPHWNTGALGEGLDDEEMMKAFEHMVTMMDRKMRNVPWPMASYWRTTSPGHVGCAMSQQLDNERESYLDPSDPGHSMFNWHLFPRMNDLVRQIAIYDRSPSTFLRLSQKWLFSSAWEWVRPSNPPIRLVDVYDLSLKRPDAHLRPGADCLHYCISGVPDVWQRMLWTFIFEESYSL